VIVKSAWEVVNEATGCRVGEDYESIVKLWLCNKKYGNVNMVVAAVCQCMWKLRSSLCFQGAAWVSRKVLWWRVLAMLRCWRIMVPLKILDGFDAVLASLERLVAAPEQISWSSQFGV
jgi:hypothetical protein